MREIKFKYIYKNSAGNISVRVFDLDDIANGDHWDYTSDCPLMRDYKIIDRLQYTGIKDNGGVEIFEGDVFNLGDKNIKYVVIFKDGQFVGRQVGSMSTVGIYCWTGKVKVIGNIHEDPELIK